MASANILLRGQSDAVIFGSEYISGLPGGAQSGLGYMEFLVSAWTGLSLNTLYNGSSSGVVNPNTQNLNGGWGTTYTAVSGEGIVPVANPPSGNVTNYWLNTNGTSDTPTANETDLLYGLYGLGSSILALPTVTVWLWNEYDATTVGNIATNGGNTIPVTSGNQQAATQAWETAAETDMAYVGYAFTTVNNSYTPYVFVNSIPYFASGDNAILDAGQQAIKLGMSALALSSYHATITAENGDLNMDDGCNNTGIDNDPNDYGGPPMSQYDIEVVAYRAALAVANQLQAASVVGSYLHPTSTSYSNPLPQLGAIVTGAATYGTVGLNVAFASGTQLASFQSGTAQAHGMGWTIQQGGKMFSAVSATNISSNGTAALH